MKQKIEVKLRLTNQIEYELSIRDSRKLCARINTSYILKPNKTIKDQMLSIKSKVHIAM